MAWNNSLNYGGQPTQSGYGSSPYSSIGDQSLNFADPMQFVKNLGVPQVGGTYGNAMGGADPGAMGGFNYTAGSAPSAGGGFGQWMKDSGMMGSTENGIKTDGWGGLALGAAQGLMSGFMGMKQYGLAKKTLAHNQDVFNKNYAAQRQTTNTRLEDRQKTVVAMNSNNTPVAEYMNKNRIV